MRETLLNKTTPFCEVRAFFTMLQRQILDWYLKASNTYYTTHSFRIRSIILIAFRLYGSNLKTFSKFAIAGSFLAFL